MGTNTTAKTKAQLINEIAQLRQKIAELTQFKGMNSPVQEQLKKQRNQYQLIFDSVPAGIWYVDREGRVVRVNQTGASAFGMPQEEIIGKSLRQLLPPEEVSNIISDVQEIINTGKPKMGIIEEYTMVSGEKRTTQSDKIPYRDPKSAEIIGMVVLVLDITEQRKAEDELKESREIFRLFLEHNPIYVFFKDENIRSLYLSRNYEKMLNMPLNEILGKTMDEIFPSDLAKNMIADDRKVLQENRIVEVEEELDGRYYTTTKFPIVRQGKPPLLAGFTIDITEQKKIEEALRLSESRLSQAMDLAHVAFWEFDLTENVFIFNDPYYALYGTTAEKEGGYRITREEHAKRFVHPDDRLRVSQSRSQNILLHGPEFPPDIEHRIIRRDKEVRHVLVRAKAVMDESGRVVKRYGITQDITKQKEAEKALQDSLARLRRLVGYNINIIGRAVGLKCAYTAGHQRGVSNLARAIATEMGLSADEIECIRMAGSIHDVGKIAIPAEILSMPRKLTAIEFNLMKTHTRRGREILEGIEFPWPLAEIVVQHHERLDGSGYPRRLKDDQVLLEARIIGIADVVQAMADHRPYRPALGIDAALSEIEKHKGVLYDPDAVDACVRLFREKGFTI